MMLMVPPSRTFTQGDEAQDMMSDPKIRNKDDLKIVTEAVMWVYAFANDLPYTLGTVEAELYLRTVTQQMAWLYQQHQSGGVREPPEVGEDVDSNIVQLVP